MREFNRRRSRREEIVRFSTRAAGALVLLLVTFMAVRAAWGMYGKFASSAAADEAAQQNLASLQKQEAQVSGAVGSLSSDRGVEAQIRQRYGVAKPGEGEIQIVTDSASSSPPAASSENIFVRIFHAIFPW
jgi:cell division protein FtsB